jgi:putative endonuclease
MADDGIRGARGEEAAARFLARRGWSLLARNWRGAGGELDVVAARRGVVAVCEVKTRTSAAALVEPLTAAQRVRIARAAAAFLMLHPELAAHEVRLDLLVVRADRRWRRVRHLPGAFDAPVRRHASNRRSTG